MPSCGHTHCPPAVCRFADTDPVTIIMRQGDRRDASNFNLLARVAPKLSTRGKISLYSGIYSKDH